MPKRTAHQHNEPTEEEKEAEATRFLRSPLGIQLTGQGIELERFDIPTNFKGFNRISERTWRDSDKRTPTIMGKEYYEEKAASAHRGFRLLSGAAESFLGTISPLPVWSFWQQKSWEAVHDSKSAVETEGMAETLGWYNYKTPHFSDVDSASFERLKPHIRAVLDDMNAHFDHATVPKIEDFESWKGKFNKNRNSGWPFFMPISGERMETVDWPNFKHWVFALASAMTREQLEELATIDPTSVANANERIYAFFMRPTDRVIHGIRLLWKFPGAYATAGLNEPLKGSQIGWASLDAMADEFAMALADAECVSADDLKKFDRSIHPEWFHAIYEVFWESDFLSQHPALRNIIGALIYEFTKEARLQLSSSHFMWMHPGLWSGHPLTQWIGSVIHLTLYSKWSEELSLEPVLQKVLSDDGIQIYRDVTVNEMETMLSGVMSDDLKEIGMLMHPDKTKVADPNIDIYIGQLDGHDMYLHDMPFFLKRNMQRQKALSHGNSLGVPSSILQTEREATDAAIFSSVQPYIRGYDDLTLGGGPPKRLYDAARIVDIVASCGRGNPLVEDTLHYVITTWPGWLESGVDYLTNKIDLEWRKEETTYAGGTLKSGLTREWAAEALLDLDSDYRVWDELVFRV